ncbi:hypothetical protein CPB83DRAFT_899986 [Crepidotus variabilis]|uniref:Uncharacterized protein n=1 Tax=Crepidotus variabilis TaxID=179855 RepID=A0A9P6E3U5_9AGAR|nr:hypothetical protein CPB83DRAFT_899986 [Crepidotus variabilis]
MASFDGALQACLRCSSPDQEGLHIFGHAKHRAKATSTSFGCIQQSLLRNKQIRLLRAIIIPTSKPTTWTSRSYFNTHQMKTLLLLLMLHFSYPQTLAQILELYQVPTHQTEQDMEACEIALVADHVDRSMAIEALPDITEEQNNALKETVQSLLGPDLYDVSACRSYHPAVLVLDLKVLGRLVLLRLHDEIETSEWNNLYINNATLQFEIHLTQFIAMGDPFARAIQCLEATSAGPGDVFLYWIAIVARIKRLRAIFNFNNPNSLQLNIKIPAQDTSKSKYRTVSSLQQILSSKLANTFTVVPHYAQLSSAKSSER